MVVGAYIKDGMVFTIVPTDDFFVRLGKGKERLVLLAQRLAFVYLCYQPATADYGGSLEEFHWAIGIHLARYYTHEIVLNGQLVDGHDFILMHHQSQYALEGLCLLSFPMKGKSDGHIVQRERW